MKRTGNLPDDSASPDTEAEQPAKDYYYDDATGYEVYDPKDEQDEEGQNCDL